MSTENGQGLRATAGSSAFKVLESAMSAPTVLDPTIRHPQMLPDQSEADWGLYDRIDQVSAAVGLAVDKITQALPSGTVTFLATDIEKSTELLGRLGDRYEHLLMEHRRIIRRVIARWGGYVEECRADEFFTVFGAAPAAISAAIEIQRELDGKLRAGGEELRVRTGLHTGNPRLLKGEYVGLDVHHAVRVCAAAHGGQIVLSDTTAKALAASDLGGAIIDPLGVHQLKGFANPEFLYQLVVPALRSEFPPLAAPVAAGALYAAERQRRTLKPSHLRENRDHDGHAPDRGTLITCDWRNRQEKAG